MSPTYTLLYSTYSMHIKGSAAKKTQYSFYVPALWMIRLRLVEQSPTERENRCKSKVHLQSFNKALHFSLCTVHISVIGITIDVLYSKSVDGWLEHKRINGMLSFLEGAVELGRFHCR